MDGEIIAKTMGPGKGTGNHGERPTVCREWHRGAERRRIASHHAKGRIQSCPCGISTEKLPGWSPAGEAWKTPQLQPNPWGTVLVIHLGLFLKWSMSIPEIWHSRLESYHPHSPP